MPHPRLVALGLALWLGACPLADALAQGRGGPGMRVPLGGSSLGGSPRPPQLALPSNPNRPGDGRFRPFFPYWPYWPDGYYGYDDYYADSSGYSPADSARNVLAAETVRSPPFVAVLNPPAQTAYAGMTVVLPGGALETQYVPYRLSLIHI